MSRLANLNRRLVTLSVACFLWAAPSLAQQQTVPIESDASFFEAYRRDVPITSWPLKKILREIPELAGLEPAVDQSPLPEILRRVGENLQTFLADFVNTTSLETIEETQKNKFWGTQESVVQQFHYLMLAEREGNTENLVEHRADPHGREERPDKLIEDFLKTTGFASMPLFFGLREQHLSDFRYLGQQSLQGRRTEVVAFAEHIEPAAVRGRFVVGHTSVPLLLQGVAWIHTNDYQILQMRTDLLAPQPGVELKRATTVVSFESVKFQGRAAAFWLPQEVDVTLDQGNYLFVNRHRYSDYQLFKVEILQQMHDPEPAAPQHH
jgi:hypothetical protein